MFSGVPPQVEEGKFRVEFPDIFRTLILNREIMPGGRGKRLRVRGDFTGIVANVQANQARYLYLYCKQSGTAQLYGNGQIFHASCTTETECVQRELSGAFFCPPQRSTG